MRYYRPTRGQTHAAVTWLFLAFVCCAIAGCAIFDAMKPALWGAALDLIAQLDGLLFEYENAEMGLHATSDQISAFSELQDARHAVIQDLLAQCTGLLDEKRLRDYQARFIRAANRSP